MDERIENILNITENVYFKPIHFEPVIRENTGTEIVPGDVLFVEQAAVHANRISNNDRMFTGPCLNGSLADWTRDYPKPILVNHDIMQDPLGRIVAAMMEEDEDGYPYQKLVLGIIDADAIQKILDGRYNTGSVGGKAIHAVCSICNKDIIKDSAPVSGACKHMSGEVYKGKRAYTIFNQVRWVEYSFVNVPADTKSRKLSARFANVGEAEELQEDLYQAPRYYFIPNREERVLAFSEGESLTIDVSEDSPQGAIYLTFMEAAESLWNEARLEIATDSANPEAMEVIKGVPPTTPPEGNSVTEEDIEQICAEVREMLTSKVIPPQDGPIDEVPVSEEVWDSAYVNALPDAAFALVSKEKRSLPHHSKGVKSASENSSVDKTHLRNALARANQVQGFSAEAKARAVAHLKRHASALGIGEEEIEDLLENGEVAFANWLEENEIEYTSYEDVEEINDPAAEETEVQETEIETPDTEDSTTEPAEGEEDTEDIPEEESPGEETVTEEEAVEEGEEPPTEETLEEEEPTEDSEDPTESEETSQDEDLQEEEPPAEEAPALQELQNELHILREQNAALRQEIHFFIARSVVEEMLRNQLITEEEQSDCLSEHLTRSTTSLKDKLGDLLKNKNPKVGITGQPEMEETVAPEGSKEPAEMETEDREIQEETVKPPTVVDVFEGLLHPHTYGDYLQIDKNQR